MATEPEVYVPVAFAAGSRRQAWISWSLVVAVICLWVASILAAPLAKADGALWLSAPLYRLFSFICHQMPSRSFFVDGEPFGVCSRCFGVYFGLLVGAVIYPLWRRIEDVEPLPRFWLFLSLFPIAIDWSLTIFGIWENTFTSRFITGMILGLACATYIVPAVVEIRQNLHQRRRRAVRVT